MKLLGSPRLRTLLISWLLLGAGFVVAPATASAEEPRAPSVRAQLQAERRAIRLVARPEVRQTLKSLEQPWRDKLPGLLPETYAQLASSLQEIAFFVAVQVVDSDARRPQVIEISAAPHRWFDTSVPGGRWGINNPDTLYFTIPVEPASRYVITGLRHGAGPIDSNFTLQTPDVFGAVDNFGQRDLRLAPDGSYRITVDDQPANGRPNHLQIRGGATQVLIRNTLADWSHEQPDTLTVERVAGPEATPPLSEDALAKEVIRRLAAVLAHTQNTLQPPIFRHPANFIPQPGALADKPGFLPTQRNTLGHFRLADDEALVATFNPGGAGYATFPVTNVWGISPDSRTRQNSLNTKQAVPNQDGSITVVVANWDPGITNWIDPAGLREGIVMLRWQLLAAATPGTAEPAVTAQLVKRSELGAALPKSIARVTAPERREQAARRAAGFDRRFTAR